MKLSCVFTGLFVLLTQLAPAQVMLNPIFADEAVLRRGVEVPVWGSAAPGETVTVDFSGNKQTATAAADGSRQVNLAPLTASAEDRVGADAAPRPNVVLILPDDLSYNDYSMFNPKGPQTPCVDALAQTGVRLTDSR